MTGSVRASRRALILGSPIVTAEVSEFSRLFDALLSGLGVLEALGAAGEATGVTTSFLLLLCARELVPSAEDRPVFFDFRPSPTPGIRFLSPNGM